MSMGIGERLLEGAVEAQAETFLWGDMPSKVEEVAILLGATVDEAENAKMYFGTRLPFLAEQCAVYFDSQIAAAAGDAGKMLEAEEYIQSVISQAVSAEGYSEEAENESGPMLYWMTKWHMIMSSRRTIASPEVYKDSGAVLGSLALYFISVIKAQEEFEKPNVGLSIRRNPLSFLSRLAATLSFAESSVRFGSEEKERVERGITNNILLHEAEKISRNIVFLEDMLFERAIARMGGDTNFAPILQTEDKFRAITIADFEGGKPPLVFFRKVLKAVPGLQKILQDIRQRGEDWGIQTVPKSNIAVLFPRDFVPLREQLDFKQRYYTSVKDTQYVLLMDLIRQIGPDRVVEMAVERMREKSDYFRTRIVLPKDRYDEYVGEIIEANSKLLEGEKKAKIFIYCAREIEGEVQEEEIDPQELVQRGESVSQFIRGELETGSFCALYINNRMDIPDLSQDSDLGFELSLVSDELVDGYLDMREDYIMKRYGWRIKKAPDVPRLS